MKNLTSKEKIEILQLKTIQQEYFNLNLNTLKINLNKEEFNTLAQFDFIDVIDTLADLQKNIESGYVLSEKIRHQKKMTKKQDEEQERLHNMKKQLKLELLQKVMDI